MDVLDLTTAVDVAFTNDASLIDITAMQEPDPAWRFVDPAGHVHRWTKSGNLISVVEVVDETWVMYYDDETGEPVEQSRTHYECRRCRALVTPGYREGRQTYITGLKRQELTVTLPGTALANDCITAIYAGEPVTVRLPHVGERKVFVRDVSVDDNVRVTMRVTK